MDSEKQKYFYRLTPDKILDAVEELGAKTTGRCLALNSFENRVYQIELEKPHSELWPLGGPFFEEGHKIIAKFYRPYRWTKEQILEEHRYLTYLYAEEISVIPPFTIKDQTLHQIPEVGIYYALFPYKIGRAPEELPPDDIETLGRLIGRMHQVGRQLTSSKRDPLDISIQGKGNIQFLLEKDMIPSQYQESIQNLSHKLFEYFSESYGKASKFWVHGDCHLGNILWDQEMFFLVDFDDTILGPPSHDLWPVIERQESRHYDKRLLWDSLLTGYETMTTLDEASLKLIPLLRGLRMMTYWAWIGRRWEDPIFKQYFSFFDREDFWFQNLKSIESLGEMSQNGRII